jgi:hypothetical protein
MEFFATLKMPCAGYTILGRNPQGFVHAASGTITGQSFSNPLALLIGEDAMNAVRLTFGVSLGCARFNFVEPRAELILVDDGNPEEIRFHGFCAPRAIAGNRQCDENRSCRGHGNHCRVVEGILKHAQLVRAARTRISPHLCARSQPGGFLNGEMQGMTVALDRSAPSTSPAICCRCLYVRRKLTP